MENLFGSALLLAGGQSRRMGFDKQTLNFNFRNIELLKEVFSQVIVSSSRGELYDGLGVTVCEDVFGGMGPLSGLHAGLRAAESEFCYVLACDMPFVSREFIRYMEDVIMASEGTVDICGVRRLDGRMESMNSFYRSALWMKAGECIEQGNLSVKSLRKAVQNVVYIPETEALLHADGMDIFANANTREELERLGVLSGNF